MLGSNKVVTLNRVTFVEPGRRDDIGRVQEIFWKEKELSNKRVDREQPGVPDLSSFRYREVFLRARVSIIADPLN